MIMIGIWIILAGAGNFIYCDKAENCGYGSDEKRLMAYWISRIHEVLHIFDKFVNENTILYRGITPRYTLLTLFTLFTWLDLGFMGF